MDWYSCMKIINHVDVSFSTFVMFNCAKLHMYVFILIKFKFQTGCSFPLVSGSNMCHICKVQTLVGGSDYVTFSPLWSWRSPVYLQYLGKSFMKFHIHYTIEPFYNRLEPEKHFYILYLWLVLTVSVSPVSIVPFSTQLLVSTREWKITELFGN